MCVIPVRVFPLYSNCLINPLVAFSLVIVWSLLTSHDPLSMFNIPVYKYSSLSICQTVRTLILILCWFCVGQFIERLCKTPLCFLILILPSLPDTLLFWFWLRIWLITLLPIVLYFVFLITWLPTLLRIKQRFLHPSWSASGSLLRCNTFYYSIDYR